MLKRRRRFAALLNARGVPIWLYYRRLFTSLEREDAALFLPSLQYFAKHLVALVIEASGGRKTVGSCLT